MYYILLMIPCPQSSVQKIEILNWLYDLLCLSKMYHLHFLQIFCNVLSFCSDWYIVVLSLLLGQQLEPPSHRALDNLTHTKAQGPHEVIPGCSVPIPDLNWQTPIFVFSFQVSKDGLQKSGWTEFYNSYIFSVSFQTGFRLSLIVLVFFFCDSPFSGMSLILTYGSLRPLGSIGIRLHASTTAEEQY